MRKVIQRKIVTLLFYLSSLCLYGIRWFIPADEIIVIYPGGKWEFVKTKDFLCKIAPPSLKN